MPTIAAGTSATFSIPAGQVATMTAGTGIAVLAFPTSSPMAITAKSVLGPYESTRIINVAATTAIDYTVATPSTGTGPSAALGIVTKPTITTPAVAGTSISGAFSAVGTPTPSTAIAWLLDDVVISGATAIPYASQASDSGKALKLRVTASNTSGTLVSTSDAVVMSAGAITTIPFNTTDAFSTGQSVVYAGGIYTFTAPHPAGNWTGNDVTYNGQNGDSPLNTVGFSKPMGVVSAWTAGTLATGNTTTPTQSRGLKMDAEAPFTRVRAAMFQREPTPQRGYAISVASTETDAVNTLSNAINPIVNGTAHSVIKGADQYGFARLLWSGAQRSQVQPGCGVTVPGQGYTTNMSSVFSDWVDCSSVPVVTGKRPMLVARLSRIVNIGDANSNVSTNGTTGSYNRYVANDPTGRLLINMLAGTNGDHVADPTLSQSTGATYDPTTTSSWQNLAFIFEHSIPTRVFGGFGDSITEGYGIWQNPVLQISTQKAPCYLANFGCSTNRSAQYQALLESQLRGENYLTDIIMPSFSPNEPPTITTAMADGFIAELDRMRALCAAYKKRLYIWTSYAALTTRYSGTASATEIGRINAWVRTEAAKPGATFQLIEIADGYDNATMTIGGADNTHPNATGVAYFNSRILPAIQKGI